ncbi:hypothetical protein GOP47_0020261, partial [Adiantum capillus-veneris]
ADLAINGPLSSANNEVTLCRFFANATSIYSLWNNKSRVQYLKTSSLSLSLSLSLCLSHSQKPSVCVMVTIIVQVPLGSTKEEDYWKLRNFPVDSWQWWGDLTPRYIYLKHALTTESLWLDGCQDPSKEIDRKKPGLPDASPFRSSNKGSQIQDEDVAAAPFVFSLRACAKHKDLYRGTRLHDRILKKGLLEQCSDALVTMYAKCGDLDKAKWLLDMHPSTDVITWTALIAGYAREGQGQNALDCFERMQHEGIAPNAVTYICILKACGAFRAGDKGELIHHEIAKQGLLLNDVMLGTALVDMYAKCGALSKAQDVLEKLTFRDVVCWNALIAGYAEEGQAEKALNCFECMQCEGIAPNAVTYLCILKACASVGASEKGKQVHDEITRQGLLQDNPALGSALVNMYAKCGALEKAQDVLDTLLYRDVVSWNSLITGYAQEGYSERALSCFERMQREGISPDAFTYSCVLKACASLGAADKGKEIYDEIAKQGLLQDNIVLGTALVDMYAKCGALSKAQDVLERHRFRDLVSWNVLIAGYAQEGQQEQALNCFHHMQREAITPNVVTFVCALNVCNHLGLVEEGHAIYTSMGTKYNVQPNLECNTCMVDLFGRAGHLEKAVELIHEMPSCDDSALWLTLLGACRKWRDINVGRWAFEQAVRADKSVGAAYVLMADIYAAAGMQEDARDIEAMRIRNRA